MTTVELVGRIARAGLTGRGGGAFPTATKLAQAAGRRCRLVINACEGESLSAKDAWLIGHRLAEVLSAARAIATAIGATRTVIAVHRGSWVHRALAADPRLVASGIGLLPAPPRYVSSESSALVSLLDGGLARPVTRRIPLSTAGPGRSAPAVVLNLETVWAVGLIERHGPDWFAGQGRPDAPGVRLATVSGCGLPQTVVESWSGEALATVVGRATGSAGAVRPVRAVLLGGYGGGWLDAEVAWRTPWADRDLVAYDTSTGNGVIFLLGHDQCPLSVVSAQLDYLADESAGQCGPCMFGLPAVAADWRTMITGGPPADEAVSRLRRRLGLLAGRGACHHPDGAARNARTALAVFADDVAVHRRQGCTAASPAFTPPARTSPAFTPPARTSPARTSPVLVAPTPASPISVPVPARV